MLGLGEKRKRTDHWPWLSREDESHGGIPTSPFFPIPLSQESKAHTSQPFIPTAVGASSSGAPSANAPSTSSPLKDLSTVSQFSSDQQLGAAGSTLSTQMPSSLSSVSPDLSAPNGSPSSTHAGSNPLAQVTSASLISSTLLITLQVNSPSSFGGSTLSTSESTRSSSSTPVAASTTSNVNLSSPIIAVIVISILVLLSSIALGVWYFLRRRRQREIAFLSLGEACDPFSATMNEVRVASCGSVSSLMTSGSMTSSDAVTIVGRLSEPNPFASPPMSPVQDAAKLVAHNLSDVDTFSQTTSDSKHPVAVAETAGVSSPAPSSRGSLSLKVPFFYHLKAMRRQGEMCKTPAIEPRGGEYTHSDTDSTRLTGNDTGIYALSLASSGNDHVGTVCTI